MEKQEVFVDCFDFIDVLLPEFGFKRTEFGWQSTTDVKVDGSRGKRGKVYIYKDKPDILIDYTRNPVNIWNYVKQSRNFSRNKEVFDFLNQNGKEIGNTSITFNEIMQKSKKKLEDSKVWHYLLQRGFNSEEIKSLDIGCCDGLFFSELKDRFAKGCEFNFGNNHALLIGLRDLSGIVVGFTARKLNNSEPKYLINKGFKKNENLITLQKSNKINDSVIIVEGILDAMLGFSRMPGSDFVALLGTSISDLQVKQVADRWKNVYLMLDNDEAGKNASDVVFAKLSQAGIIAKVLCFPENIKDLNDFFNKNTYDESFFSSELKKNDSTNITTEDYVKNRLCNRYKSLSSGYSVSSGMITFPSGGITILAAPTGHGKTSMLINFAVNALLVDEETDVFFFSYEEDDVNIILKMLTTFVDLPEIDAEYVSDFYSGDGDVVKNAEFIAVKDRFYNFCATKRLNVCYTDDSVDKLIDRIMKISARNNDENICGTTHASDHAGTHNARKGRKTLIIVDYFQLLRDTSFRGSSRQEELKQICLKLKDCAVLTGLPIVAAAQFNREVRSESQLVAASIGEAGDIERISSLVLGLWNRRFSASSDDDIFRVGKGDVSQICLRVLKNRYGRVGDSAILDFNGKTGKIFKKGSVL